MARQSPKKSAPKKEPKPRAANGSWQAAFLSALAETGNLTAACLAAKIDRSTARKHQANDEAFAVQVAEAKRQAGDALEIEARRRAVDGLRRYQFCKGEPVIDPRTGEPYYELEYSDTLLIFLLKATKPRKYRERFEVKHRGKVKHTVADLTDDQLLAIAKNKP